MRTYVIPSYPEATPDQINALKFVNVIQGNIPTYASPADYRSQTAWQPPVDGAPKYWRDNNFIWFPDQTEAFYIVLDRDNPTLELTTATVPHESFSHEVTFGTLSQESALFLRNNIAYFPRIPRLKLVRYTAAEAQRLSFATGTSPDFPVAMLYKDPTRWSIEYGGERYTTTFRTDMCIRFNEANQPELFFFSEWVKPATPPSIGLPDNELVTGATAIVGSPMPVPQKAAALRNLLKR